MERFFLVYTGKRTKKGHVKLNVFLKDVDSTHRDALKSFLAHQQICVKEIPKTTKNNCIELSYFNDGFEITYAPTRWSYFKMRDYIYSYLLSWHTDLSFCSRYLKDFISTEKEQTFDDHFYVELSRLIDECEDRYYLGNRSIAIFLNNILKILKESLQLYWASATLQDTVNDKHSYINHVPETIPQKEIVNTINSNSDKIIKYPVTFNDETIAYFHISPSPYTPNQKTIKQFLEYVITMIDDFIYGDRLFRKETFKLRAKIAELEKNSTINTNTPHLAINAFPEQDKQSTRLLILGATDHIEEKQIFISIQKAGFNKKKVELFTDYHKMKHFDINNLTKMRSKYDGILLGPMPHKMQGKLTGDSLISMMEHDPDKYPPFVVIRNHAGGLKVSKKSFKIALKNLSEQLDTVNQYQTF